MPGRTRERMYADNKKKNAADTIQKAKEKRKSLDQEYSLIKKEKELKQEFMKKNVKFDQAKFDKFKKDSMNMQRRKNR